MDASTNLLLLNMTVNHSALSIHNSLSKEPSTSFSEIRVTSIAEELQDLLDHTSSEQNFVSQIFCSSQDERVQPTFICNLGDFGCDWRLWISVLFSLSADVEHFD